MLSVVKKQLFCAFNMFYVCILVHGGNDKRQGRMVAEIHKIDYFCSMVGLPGIQAYSQ